MGSRGEIKLYSHPDCPWCRKTKELFDEYGVEYKDLNIAFDLKAMQDWIYTTDWRDVPVVEINGEIIAGYNPGKLKQRLGVRLLPERCGN